MIGRILGNAGAAASGRVACAEPHEQARCQQNSGLALLSGGENLEADASRRLRFDLNNWFWAAGILRPLGRIDRVGRVCY